MAFDKPQRHQDRALLDLAHKGRCVVCSRVGCDGDHIKTKGSGGPDLPWNIMHLCRVHHTEKHQIGLVTFAKKYWKVHRWLLSNGWEFCEVRNKWNHENK